MTANAITLEQAERLARKDVAESALAARGIRLDSGLTVEQLEALAEVVKTWKD